MQRNVTFDDLDGLHLDWASLLVLGLSIEAVSEILAQEFVVADRTIYFWGIGAAVKATLQKSPNGARIDFGGKTALRPLPLGDALALIMKVRTALGAYTVNLTRLDWAVQLVGGDFDRLVDVATGHGFRAGKSWQPTAVESPSGRTAYRYRTQAIELRSAAGLRACAEDKWTIATYEAITECGLPVVRTEVREQFASRSLRLGMEPKPSAETLAYLRDCCPGATELQSAGVDRQTQASESARRATLRAVTTLYKHAYVIENGRLLPALGVIAARTAVVELALVAVQGDVDELLERWPKMREHFADAIVVRERVRAGKRKMLTHCPV